MYFDKLFKQLGIWVACVLGLYVVLEMFGLGYIVDYGITLLLVISTSAVAYTKGKVIHQGIKQGEWESPSFGNKIEMFIICVYSVCAGMFISVGSVLEIVIGVLLIVNALETAYILKKSGRLG